MPGKIQGQAGQGSEQPDPVEDVPAHCRGVGLDGWMDLPSNPDHSMILHGSDRSDIGDLHPSAAGAGGRVGSPNGTCVWVTKLSPLIAALGGSLRAIQVTLQW